MKRIFLLAGYDKKCQIQDYVVYMVRKLSEIGDVYYAGNGKIPPDELFKIAPYTQRLFTKEHKMRDFGSWHYLIEQLGWAKLSQYDEIVFCNDSVYGPLSDLQTVFSQMERKGFDFWSVTADYDYKFHLHRYFMVFNRDVVQNPAFQKFWNDISISESARYSEYKLTSLLADEGFVGNSYIRSYKQTDIMQTPEALLSDYSVPFVKIKSFLPANKYSAGSGLSLRYKIRKYTDYDTALINHNITANHYPQTWAQKLVALTGI